MKKILFAILLLSFGINQAMADSHLQSTLQKSLSGRQVVSVAATPASGLFEVVLDGKQIVYTTADGAYILVGELINVSTQKNLTAAKMKMLNVVNFSAFPLNKAIKDVRGNGARKLLVFSDPDCSYCKRLEAQGLKGLNNVTIYTFLLPLSMHPDAGRKARIIWCADNRVSAWEQWMRDGKLANDAGKCANPLASLAKLAERLGITAVPTLVFENGQLAAGALAPQDIEKYLDAASQAH